MKRTSITLEDSTYKAGLLLAKEAGFQNSFSAFLDKLIVDKAASQKRPEKKARMSTR